MLIKEFYEIINFTPDESGVIAVIILNPDHEVYKGHFPEQPVVPGVIQLQIVKELIEKHIAEKLIMSNITQVKYLVPIIPADSPQLVITNAISKIDNAYKVNAVIKSDATIFTKIKVTLTFDQKN